jgi:DNA-binding transcriptional LysR family regulator
MADANRDYAYLGRYASELCAFVLIARHGQLTAAAKAMRMSQPGLSQQLRNLEGALGATLFERTRRGVTLSPQGAELLVRVEPLVSALAATLAAYARPRRRPGVLISVDFAFASFWLLPRLSRLRESVHPVDISILTSQQPDRADSLNADIVIAMAEADDAEGTRLLDERVSAVCSPEFLRAHPELRSWRDLCGAPLLSLATPAPAMWHDWDSWFACFGEPPASACEKTSFNTYDNVVRAALDGLGVALGWHGLVAA